MGKIKFLNKKSQKKRQYAGYLYILPWVIGFCALQLYPFLSSIYYSFTNYNILNVPKFLGLKNYVDIFKTDPLFLRSLGVTVNYVLLSVPFKLTSALVVALILSQKLRGINMYRTIYYLPSIFGGSVGLAALWKFMFHHNGTINAILEIFNLGPVDWLGNPSVALFTISSLSIWQFGSSMVLFLAGLKQIPTELYEAALVDGAGTVRVFTRITIPLLTPIIFFNLVMQMINMFQHYTEHLVITNGGPLRATYVYGLMLYQTAFQFFRMGYAAALSWILFIIIMILTALIFKSSALWLFYSDEGGS